MKTFAVILAGCGVYDGAEIHEAVFTFLAIEKNSAICQCFAPDILQHHVIDHLTGAVTNESRNVLTESARITRGNIKPLSEFDPDKVDALIFPGGFGAAKNLCSWAWEGDNCRVNPEVEYAVMSMFNSGKPIGAMCIAPVILARLFQGTNLTTGQDPASGAFIEKMGNSYTKTAHGEVIADDAKKIFTTPCYMLDSTLAEIEEGTENLVRAMLKAI